MDRAGRRWFLSQAALALLLQLAAARSLTAQQTDNTNVPATTSDDSVHRAEHDQLAEKSTQLREQGKLAEAAVAGEQWLAFERGRLEPGDTKIVDSIEWLAEVYEEAENWQAAEAKRKEALAWRGQHQGADHWQTSDARLALDDVRRLRKLTPAERALVEQASSADAEVHRLYAEGRYAEAVPFAERALAIARQFVGEDHPYAAECINNIALLYQSQGEYARALPLQEKALAVYRKTRGEDHPTTALCLNNLALLHQYRGEYPQAATLYEQALATFKKTRGEHHPDTAMCLNNLAYVRYSQGEFALAMPLYEQAVAIYKVARGENDPATVTSISNLALLYQTQGDYARALPLFDQALTIRKQTLGESHPDTALSLNNLAFFYTSQGNYARAMPLFEQALAIYKTALGENHPETSTTLGNLADLFYAQGDYARALPLYQRSLSIRKLALGEHHPDTATSLNNLGLVFQVQGDFARALALQEQALAIRKQALGEVHPDVAMSLNNLALLYDSQNDGARAMPLFEQALAIYQKVLGENHPDTATVMSNLALLYRSQGDYLRAELLCKQALAIRQKTLGDHHPDTALSLNNLALLYSDQGQFARAQALYELALSNFKSALGDHHPSTALALNNLAQLAQSQGDQPRAAALFGQALAITNRHVETTSIALTERQQLIYAQNVRWYLDNLLSCLLHFEHSSGDAYEAVLDWKGAAIVRQRTARTVWEEPEIAPLFAELQSVVRQWAVMAQAKPRIDTAWKKRFDDLTARKEALEAELSRKSSAFRKATHPITTDDVLNALSPDTALVDYLEFSLSAPVTLEVRGGLGARLAIKDDHVEVAEVVPGGAAAQDGRLQPGDVISAVADEEAPFVSVAGLTLPDVVQRIGGKPGTRVRLQVRPSAAEAEKTYVLTRAEIPYQKKSDIQLKRSLLAFVVRPGRPMQMFDLGDVAPVNRAIDTWRGTEDHESYGMSDEAKSAGQLLRQALWEPLEAAIGDAKTVLISPDGALGRLPFAGLPGKKPGTYLLEDYRLALLPVPRLIPELAEAAPRNKPDKELLLLGDVDYDHRQALVAAAPRHHRLPSDRGSDVRAVTAGRRWQPLPGAAAEASSIRDLYQKTFDLDDERIAYLYGPAATEERFRAEAPHCYVLHLATHGFFAAEDKQSALAATAAVQRGDRGNPLGDRREIVRGYSPGLLSGLVFAGANDPPQWPVDPAEFDKAPDDGILTADEIAFVPLGGAHLVVLSACETGLGEVAGGEGLLGIQRAFQIAGAHTTIATLWKVDDLASRRIMEEFYRNYLANDMSPLDALRSAQLWALKNPDLIPRGVDERQVQMNDSRLPPKYWAAFTLSGDWR